LTRGSISRSIFRLALPLLAANLLQDLFNIVDTIFIGRLGEAQLAALTASGTIIGLAMVLMIGVSTGTIALVARHVGQDDVRKAENDVAQALLLAIIATFVVSPFFYFAPSHLLELMGAESDVVGYGNQYMRIMGVGAFTITISIALSSAIQGSGDAVTPMKILALSTVLNIVLDPLLIFGLGPFPEMGVTGSSLATVIARGAGLPLFFYALGKRRTILHMSWRRIRFDLKTMGAMLWIGVYSALQELVRSVSNFALYGLAFTFGTAVGAAYGVGTRLRMTVLTVGFAFAAASAVLVGQNLGAEKPQRAEKTAWGAVGFYEIMMVVMLSIFILMPEEVMLVFTDQPDVVRVGAEYVSIFGLALPFLAMSVVLSRAFGGAGETKVPMMITAISLICIRIPLAYYLAGIIGVSGIWYGLFATNVIEGLTFALLFRRGRWKEKEIGV
jgi:putative MATE family efflux protein